MRRLLPRPAERREPAPGVPARLEASPPWAGWVPACRSGGQPVRAGWHRAGSRVRLILFLLELDCLVFSLTGNSRVAEFLKVSRMLAVVIFKMVTGLSARLWVWTSGRCRHPRKQRHAFPAPAPLPLL